MQRRKDDRLNKAILAALLVVIPTLGVLAGAAAGLLSSRLELIAEETRGAAATRRRLNQRLDEVERKETVADDGKPTATK